MKGFVVFHASTTQTLSPLYPENNFVKAPYIYILFTRTLYFLARNSIHSAASNNRSIWKVQLGSIRVGSKSMHAVSCVLVGKCAFSEIGDGN